MRTKKNPKADLGRFSIIFFQVGLIFMLSITYFGLEWKSYAKEDLDLERLDFEEMEQVEIPVTQFNTPPPPPPPPPPAPEVIEVIEDVEEVEETVIRSTETNQEEKMAEIVEVSDIAYKDEEEEIEEVPFMIVEQIPVFPGCENLRTKQEQRECMSKKIEAHVKKEFDTGISQKLGLTGLNRIFVVFKINEKGEVTNIKTRAPNKRLEAEATRVVKLLPKMIPGKQREKPVAVEYSLPIMYEIRESM